MDQKVFRMVLGTLTGVFLVLAWGSPSPAGELAQTENPTNVYRSGVFQLGDGELPAGFAGAAQLDRRPDQLGPAWWDLFNARGWARDDYPLDADGAPSGNGIPDFRERFGGLWVAFTADNEDAPRGFEPSARGETARQVVNGSVAPVHDLEDVLGYLTRDGEGNVVVFVAANRIAPGSTVLELELNQDFVHVGRGGYGKGLPWRVEGSRMPGDALLKLRFEGEALRTVSIDLWTPSDEGGGIWQRVGALDGEGCDAGETLCAILNGEAIAAGPWSRDPERLLPAGSFVEVGLNIGHLLGAQPDYLTLQARTPQDISFAYFSEEGR